MSSFYQYPPNSLRIISVLLGHVGHPLNIFLLIQEFHTVHFPILGHFPPVHPVLTTPALHILCYYLFFNLRLICVPQMLMSVGLSFGVLSANQASHQIDIGNAPSLPKAQGSLQKRGSRKIARVRGGG